MLSTVVDIMNDVRKNYFTLSFCIASLGTMLLLLLNLLLGWTIGGDSEWYSAAAGGRWSELIQPYSGRFLHPLLVGFLSARFSLDVDVVFFAIAAVSVLLSFFIIAHMLRDVIRSPLLLLPLFLLPVFFTMVREVFQPDAFYTLLTALFFLLLFYGKEGASLVVLFLLFLTRESTMLLGLLFAIVALIRSRRFLCIGVVMIIATSLFVSNVAVNASQSNIHGLGGGVYLAAKLLYNSAANMFGIKLWVNTYAACEPVFRFNLPPLGIFGNIRQIGLCGFDPDLPLRTSIALLTTFGVMPVLAFVLLRNRWKWVVRNAPFWLFLAAVYGILHYVIAVPAGTGVVRIVGYSWPLFLLALPFLSREFLSHSTHRETMMLLGAHFFAAWFPFIIQKTIGNTIPGELLVVVVTVVLYWCVARVANGIVKMMSDSKLSPAAQET